MSHVQDRVVISEIVHQHVLLFGSIATQSLKTGEREVVPNLIEEGSISLGFTITFSGRGKTLNDNLKWLLCDTNPH